MSASSACLPRFTENTWSATSPEMASSLWRLPTSLLRMLSLLDENGEDDYGEIGPSQFAFKTAFRMVVDAILIIGEDVPCAPVVDSEGGIRITWSRYSKQVKLICPASKDAPVYIYQSSPAGSCLRDQNVTASVLAEKLSWLIRRESASAA